MIDMIFTKITGYEFNLPCFLVGVGCRKVQGYMKRENGSPYFEWLQTRKGKGELIVDGICRTVGHNQGFLLYPDVPHEYYAIENEWEADWIIVGGNIIERLLKSSGIMNSQVLDVNNPNALLSRMEKILSITGQDLLKSLDYSSAVYDMIVNILKYTSGDSKKGLIHQCSKLETMYEYIENNFNKVITLDELSNIAGITPQYLCTLFKKATGIRVFEYINSVRIRKSKEYLINDKKQNIADIARLCGYDDVSYFCYIFKSIEKMTPGEFRNIY